MTFYNIFDINLAVNKDYFVVFGEKKNIYTYEGNAIFETDFDQIYEYDGHYVGLYQERFYFLDVESRSATLIDLIDDDFTFNFEFNSSPLFDLGLIVLKDANNLYSIVNYDGSVKTIKVSNHEIVELKNMNQIIISEIPFEVVKSDLVKSIDQLVFDKKVDGIIEVRDETDKEGLRIAIDLKRMPILKLFLTIYLSKQSFK